MIAPPWKSLFRNPASRGVTRWLLPGIAGVGLLLSGCGREPARVFRIGILSGTDDFLAVAEGFQAGMAALGYVEGSNVVYELRRANADSAALRQQAEELAAARVDLILSIATEASVVAQTIARPHGIPVVFTYAGLEGSHLARDVRQPGGNVTGVRFPGPEQITKRIEILLQIAPRVRRIWVGYDQNYPNTQPVLELLRPLAAERQLILVECPATTLEQMLADLAARTRASNPGVDAVLLMPDAFTHAPAGWAAIRDFAAARRLPIAGSFLYTVEQGALFGNSNDLLTVGRLAAPLAGKILNGTPAGTIPVVTPEQDLWINYQRAGELQLTVPLDLLKQASKIIRSPSSLIPATP